MYLPLLIKISLRKKNNFFSLSLLDPIEAAVSKYKNHLSLNVVRGNMSKLDNPSFSFEYESFDQTLLKLEKVDPKKQF